jgi:hypothetical protein
MPPLPQAGRHDAEEASPKFAKRMQAYARLGHAKAKPFVRPNWPKGVGEQCAPPCDFVAHGYVNHHCVWGRDQVL